MSNPSGNHYLYRLEQQLLSSIEMQRLMTRIGTKATNFFQNRITDQKDINDQSFANRNPEFSNREGRSILLQKGNLRRSIRIYSIQGNKVIIASRMPYSELHNEGGEVTVTPKMKKFFWAKYYQANKRSKKRGGKAGKALSNDARNWKALALKKAGDKLKFQKRQYMGEHQQLNEDIKETITEFLKEA